MVDFEMVTVVLDTTSRNWLESKLPSGNRKLRCGSL